MTGDDHLACWRADGLLARVRFSLNDTVRIRTGPDAGRLGTVSGLLTLEPEPVYTVTLLAECRAVETPQSALSPVVEAAPPPPPAPPTPEVYHGFVAAYLTGELDARTAARCILGAMGAGGGPFAVTTDPMLVPLLEELERLTEGGRPGGA